MIKVKNDLISSEIHNKLEQSQISDINSNYDIILDEITKSQIKFITRKLVKYNKYKHKKSTWITQGLLKSIKYRDKLYKQTLLTNPDLPEYHMLKINLKTYNGIRKRGFRMAKHIYYKTCFNRFNSHAKTTWKTINEILYKSKTNIPLPKYLKEGESMIIAELDIANKFNNFFTNIGNDLESKIKYHGQNDYSC